MLGMEKGECAARSRGGKDLHVFELQVSAAIRTSNLAVRTIRGHSSILVSILMPRLGDQNRRPQ
jgi:hypothetical protein